MENMLFVVLMALGIAILLGWGYRHLPAERWQMLAAVPVRRLASGQWQAVNLTYYGFFIAGSLTLAVALLVVLLGAAQVPLAGSLLAAGSMLLVCLPAARLLAWLVESKRHTFTIGGASFVGILIAPWCLLLVDRYLVQSGMDRLPILPALAAMSIAYCLGEGLGRLACISFGCCYGKALKDCPPWLRRTFGSLAFVFQGQTKKAVYAGHLAGEPLLPVQAITGTILCGSALFGVHTYLTGHFQLALITCLTVSQLWRIISETLRADFRGFSQFTAYQKMGGLAVLYMALVSPMFADQGLAAAPEILTGLTLLWQPGVILFLQMIWLIAFVYFGRSTVTGSTVSFLLHQERV